MAVCTEFAFYLEPPVPVLLAVPVKTGGGSGRIIFFFAYLSGDGGI